MELRRAFALALRQTRKARKLTQEDFSDVSSRTYLSTLERGLKSPTLEKIDALAATLQIHPISLLTLSYWMQEEKPDLDAYLATVRQQVLEVMSSGEVTHLP